MLTYTDIVENAVLYGISSPEQIAVTTNESRENVEHALCQLLQQQKIKQMSPKFKLFVSSKLLAKTTLKTLQKRYQKTVRSRHSKLRKMLMRR